jgi:phospholipid transport system substrate-binding protein
MTVYKDKIESTKFSLIRKIRLPAFTRRSILLQAIALSASSFFYFTKPSLAKSKRIKKAEILATKIFEEIFLIIDKKISVSSKRLALLRLFDKHADVPIIARAVLGSPWRQLNDVERNKFVNAFRKYLAKKYTAQFSEFVGAKMLIEKSRDSGSKAGIMVETRLLMPGSSPIKVGWQVSDASGSFKMVDVNIEGVSLLTTERGEIRNQLSKEGGSIKRLSKALSNY